jgi:4-amino-4-deoxy-L-arabinose transferase-like glycosyltransferase
MPALLTWGTWTCVILGVVVRVRVFLYNRSLWMDEAALALTYVRKTYLELLSTGDYVADQAAPVGFSLLQRVAVDALGGSDWVLRLIPLMAGILTLPLLYVTSRRLADVPVAAIAVVLFAFAVPAIYYSTELKQYSSDAFVAVLAFYLGAVFLQADLDWYKGISFGLAGGTLTFFSQPVCFVLAACGCGIGIELLSRKRFHRQLGILALTTALWLMLFGLNWWFFVRPQMGHDWLYDYHSQSFVSLIPSGLQHGWDSAQHIIETVSNVGGFGYAGLAFFLFFAGVVNMISGRAFLALAFCSPLALAYLASGLGIYPFLPRLLIFCLPGIVFGMAWGLEALVKTTRWWGLMGLGAIMLVGSTNYVQTYHLLFNTRYQKIANQEQTKRVLEFISQNSRPNGVVYVYYGANYAVKFYRKKHLPADVRVIYGNASRDDMDGYDKEIRRMAEHDRVWLLFTHVYPFDSVRTEENWILQKVEKRGADRLKEYTYRMLEPGGVSAYLYSFGNGSR